MESVSGASQLQTTTQIALGVTHTHACTHTHAYAHLYVRSGLKSESKCVCPLCGGLWVSLVQSVRAHARAHTHARARARTLTHKHARKQMYVRAHTHTHTQHTHNTHVHGPAESNGIQYSVCASG